MPKQLNLWWPLLGLVFIEDLNLSAGEDPGCWIGDITPELCCSSERGPRGNERCFDNDFTYESCCKGKQNIIVPVETPEPLTKTTTSHATVAVEAATSSFNATSQCGVFNWRRCCDGHSIFVCWDTEFLYAACCWGLVAPAASSEEVPLNDARAMCLLRSKPWLTSPSGCPDRYFFIALTKSITVESECWHKPWWTRVCLKGGDAVKLKPVRPKSFEPLGGICVRSECDEETVASWFIPHLHPWWKFPPLDLMRVNDTHTTLPPVQAIRQYFDGTHAWAASRPASAGPPEHRRPGEPYGFQYALLEYRRTWRLSTFNTCVLTLLVGFPAVASIAFHWGCTGTLITTFAAQGHLARIVQPRGPLLFDALRFVLVLAVVFQHVVGSSVWKSPGHSHTVSAIFDHVGILARVNTSFVVLSAYLRLRRIGVSNRPEGLVARTFVIVRHAFLRLLPLAIVAGFWIYVFVFIFGTDLPMHHVLHQQGLYNWYGVMRVDCAKPAHLFSSLFLVHTLVFLKGSPCHNVAIFECLWQLDVLVFSFVSYLGKKSASFLAALAWPAAVICSATQSQNNLLARAHDFIFHWPASLAAISTSLVLSSFTAPAVRQHRHRTIMVTLLGIAGMATTTMFDLHCTASRQVNWHPVWIHIFELPYVIGFCILLRIADCCSRSGKTLGVAVTLPVRTLGRLCAGLCLSHLSVLHYLGGYAIVEQWEPTIGNVCGLTLVVLLVSIGLSFFVYFTLEAPCTCLLWCVSIKAYGRQVKPAAVSNGALTVQSSRDLNLEKVFVQKKMQVR